VNEQAADEYDNSIQEAVLRAMPGGAELIEAFGLVPWFGDDEIDRLDLVSGGKTRLVINASLGASYVESRSLRVIFEIEEIVELGLEHFYRQNVLDALRLRPAGEMQAPLYGAEPSPDDIEIVLQSTLGMDGTIRCRGVSVTFHALRPKRPKLRSGEWT